MHYTVVWQPQARDDLTNVWLDNPMSRSAITHAANAIEHFLKHYPESAGESYDDDRLLTVPPLAVVYSYSADDCLVFVKNLVFLD